jgi:hypothetical protein
MDDLRNKQHEFHWQEMYFEICFVAWMRVREFREA